MIKHNQTMTTSEWEIMRVIWTLGEATSRQIIRVMTLKKDWAPSTVKTLVTRLQKKGYLTDNGAVRDRLYTPTVDEHDAMTYALNHTIQAMCAMCVGDAMANVIETTELSQRDILNLQDVLKAKYATAPESVACNCMPNHWEELK
ncbi:CopY/TcrY family copper transport repressor [Leuconostoc rapi]|uniref:CopY/TcrY family copper transport repressor n=1 Tax=Leuconostoc rapi TaxID=1406906 RepID=UPI00195C960B|nr:CopY/TcrY family copper transport repressor [Leuconostoc rapi]MBM7436343.1 CopY/TcrY family copper transport repressor [Leuconostoc rapi]